MKRCRAAWWGGLMWVAVASGLRAHDPGISGAEATVHRDRIEITTALAPSDAEQLLPLGVRGTGRMTEAEFQNVRSHFEAEAPRLWEAAAGGTSLAPREAGVTWLEGDDVGFRATFPLPEGMERVTLRAMRLDALAPGHRQFVIVSDERGSAIAKKLLRAKDDTIVVALAGVAEGAPVKAAERANEATPTFWGFVWLGVEHIWIGYDHLLFLFALLVVCRTFRSIVKIITCFTLAHSLTLALAALDIVNLPGGFVEPAIAASIVFVGAENLVRRDREPPGRWALTFAFGLIHGFGFASVLRDLGVGGGGNGIAAPLFAFNLGVELGQIVIAAVVLPIVWQLRKNEKFVRVGVPALSAIVALAGIYWLVERTVA